METTDEKINPEFRHFIYEYVNGLQPMLTEGVVKLLAIYLTMENILLDYELDVALDFDEELESMAFVDLKVEVYGTRRKNNFKEEDIFVLDKELINSVIEKIKNFSSTDLVALTQKQSPWLDAYSDFRKNEITNDFDDDKNVSSFFL